MFYLELGTAFTIIKIIPEAQIPIDRRYLYKDFESLPMEVEIESYSNIRLKGFDSPLEVKIWNAIRKVYNFKRVKDKLSEESFKLFHGENNKSIIKTEIWLEKQEDKHSEYFI